MKLWRKFIKSPSAENAKRLDLDDYEGAKSATRGFCDEGETGLNVLASAIVTCASFLANIASKENSNDK